MRAASDQPSSYLYRTSWRSRITAFVLALISVALLILMLIRIGVLPAGPALQPTMAMLDLRMPPKPQPPSPAPKMIKPRPSSKAKAAPPVHVEKVPPPKTPPVPWNVIPMTTEQFAAADISKMSAHGTTGKAAGAAAEGNGEAGNGQGKGPGGGDEIYDVDWYVKPGRGVMDSYMSRVTAHSGWGEIKCRMIDHYHVEDCQELDEFHPARASRGRCGRRRGNSSCARPASTASRCSAPGCAFTSTSTRRRGKAAGTPEWEGKR